MVTKAMLREAAEEAEYALLKSLENKTYEPHQFSGRFERRINKIIRRAKHPIRYNEMRSAAAILLVVVILFGMVFAISPEVRAGVINWVKSTFMRYSQYSSDRESNNTQYEYQLQVVPDGYTELSTINTKDGKLYAYIHEDGHLMQFSYAYGSRGNNYFVKTDLHTHIEGLVNGSKADIYITNDNKETNAIIWRDKKTDTLFCISAKIDEELLIALAESVIKTTKSEI